MRYFCGDDNGRTRTRPAKPKGASREAGAWGRSEWVARIVTTCHETRANGRRLSVLDTEPSGPPGKNR